MTVFDWHRFCRYLLTGALGHGKIPHPTKVQLNYKFEGTESIEHGRELEKQVAAGTFKPLTDFPLLRLEVFYLCMILLMTITLRT